MGRNILDIDDFSKTNAKLTSRQAKELALMGKLPKNAVVAGYLDLSKTKVTTLPEGLFIDGYLDLEHSQIAMLPERLQVTGWLGLRGTQVANLPTDICVDEDIYASVKKIKGEKPKGVKGEIVVRTYTKE